MPINLLVGLPKINTADFILEKAQEIGIRQVSFFNAKRSQAFLNKSHSDKFDRWNKILRSAFKQSKAGELTKVSYHESSDELTTQLSLANSRKIILSLSSSKNLLEVAKGTHNYSNYSDKLPTLQSPNKSLLENHKDPADSILIVGPEGGLTKEEEEKALKAGFEAMSLGQTVLRVETAAIIACGLVSLIWQSR